VPIPSISVDVVGKKTSHSSARTRGRDFTVEELSRKSVVAVFGGSATYDIAAASLAREPETAFTAVVTGPANLMVAVTCRDTAHLYRFLTDRVGALPVRSLETSTVLRRVKQAGSLMDGPRLTDPEPPPVRGR